MSKLDDYIEKPKYEHLAKAYDALEAQLAACAAGPWPFHGWRRYVSDLNQR